MPWMPATPFHSEWQLEIGGIKARQWRYNRQRHFNEVYA